MRGLGGLAAPETSKTRQRPRNNSLLLGRRGLSYPSVAYPELRMPSEIADLPKPEILERIDTDELYSQ